MSFEIYSKPAQANVKTNEGDIFENKPIGFPQDYGSLKPYSCLIHWSNILCENGTELPEREHKAFEILTFVIKGGMNHYNSTDKKWYTLDEGDAQILRGGNGIRSVDRIHTDTQIIQVWFDPNVNQSIKQASSYNYYKSEQFRQEETGDKVIKTYVDDFSPISIDIPKVKIREILFYRGKHSIQFEEDFFYSGYILEGDLEVNNRILSKDDFFIAVNEDMIEIMASRTAKMFIVSTPALLGYDNYYEQFTDRY